MTRKKSKSPPPFDPTEIVGEILGRPSQERPVLAKIKSDRNCPFTKEKCSKPDRAMCSFWEWSGNNRDNYSRRLVATCPNRFHEADFLKDVARICWKSRSLSNIKALREVNLPEFGRIDYVLIKTDRKGEIIKFLPIEVQAVDITTPAPLNEAHAALYSGDEIRKRPSTGGNWDNVYKRYVTQLIRKGFVAQSWGTKIVAVIQDELFNYIFSKYPFMVGDSLRSDEANIIFVTYGFEVEEGKTVSKIQLRLARSVPTNHASLQSAYIYKSSMSRDEFAAKLLETAGKRVKAREAFSTKHGAGTINMISDIEILTSKGG